MVMLTTLRRFHLVDARQQRLRLLDFIVDLYDEDYPPVTHLLVRDPRRQQIAVPWEQVQSVDWKARQIIIADLSATHLSPPDSLQKEMLLGRDLLDALILDLQNRRATRANDLFLEQEGEQLRLKAVDASVRAVWRRMSRGLFAAQGGLLYDWKNVEFLRGEPRAARDRNGSHLRIAHLPPGEIALLSEQIPYLHATELLTLLPDPIAADVLEVMTDQRQLQVFEVLEEDQALRLLALMSPDIAADLVGRLRPERARRYLEHLPKKKTENIIELLRYPSDTAGGIMTNDVVLASADLTVGAAHQELQSRLQGPDFTHFIYVIESDETRRLLGVISLRELYTAATERRLEEIMNPYLLTVRALDNAKLAAYQVINSALAALPVIGAEGQLLGVITVDSAVAQVAPASWRSQAPKVFT